MALNTESIVPQLRRDFETLVEYVSGPASAEHDVYTVELHLFQRLLALGAALLGLFFRTRAAARPPTPVGSDGQPMACQARRSVRYLSIFGALWVARHYFTATGQPSSTPLDAELSLCLRPRIPICCANGGPTATRSRPIGGTAGIRVNSGSNRFSV